MRVNISLVCSALSFFQNQYFFFSLLNLLFEGKASRLSEELIDKGRSFAGRCFRCSVANMRSRCWAPPANAGLLRWAAHALGPFEQTRPWQHASHEKGAAACRTFPSPLLQEPSAGSRAAHGHHQGLVFAGAGLYDASGAWAHGTPISAGCSISRTKQLQHQYPWQNSSLRLTHARCCKLGVHLASCTVQVQTNDQKRLCRFQFLFIDSAWVSPKHWVLASQHICWKYLLHLLLLRWEGFWCTYSLPCNYNVH